jgi:hypothetical protein
VTIAAVEAMGGEQEKAEKGINPRRRRRRRRTTRTRRGGGRRQ